MEIGSPGTRRDMVQRHKNCEGYQCVDALEDLTKQYVERGGYRGNMTKITDIAAAIDRDTHELAQNTELWRALTPPEYSQDDATMGYEEFQRMLRKYWEILDRKAGDTVNGTGSSQIPFSASASSQIPFSASADPLLAASKYGTYARAGGEESLGVIIKFMAPKGTPVVITNPDEAEYIIGSGYVLRIRSVERNVEVEMQGFRNCNGTCGEVKKLVADRVIDAILEKRAE